MAYVGTAVLPTGENINPAKPAGAPYYAPDLVAYVMFKLNEQRTRPTRVLTSAGLLGPDWMLDMEHMLYHDQTGAQLGTYKVVGIHDFASGETAGDVPDIKMSHSVFK